jgi:hypothetical protein
LNGIQEVSGSIPLSSTSFLIAFFDFDDGALSSAAQSSHSRMRRVSSLASHPRIHFTQRGSPVLWSILQSSACAFAAGPD